MAALRKMLGSLEDPSVKELMRVIETQSKTTLAAWSAAYMREHVLPVLADCGDTRPEAAIAAVEAYIRGERTLKELKPFLADARTASRELTTTPVVQAAARAIGVAAAVIMTPTGALGWTFYNAAVYAYRTAGTDSTREEQDRLAAEEMQRVLASLRAAAVDNEPNPVKVDWGC